MSALLSRRRRRRQILGELGRRDLLRGALATVGTYLVGGVGSSVTSTALSTVATPALVGCSKICDIEPETKKDPRADWIPAARIGGLEAYATISDCDIATRIDAMMETGVSVVEIDTNLSAYMTDLEFAKELEALEAITKACHMRGMRAVAYYPSLEVLTANAAATPHTMAKDHPDWIQLSINGKPNMFIGGKDVGGGHVFWVEDGVESAWMCPSSPYVDYFIKRCERLARETSLDGVWIDVPLLSDIAGLLPCVNASCRDLFKQQTGMDAPLPFDIMTVPEAERAAKDPIKWTDAAFRRWIVWRHQLIHEFEQKVLRAVKAVRPSFELITETVTMDYNGGTAQGLDGAAYDDGGLYRVWEVDAVSDAQAMRGAGADDWICTAVMMKHGAGATGQRPTWAFTYGEQPEDAEIVMGLAFTAGIGPYESKIPVMNASVGAEYRTRMFSWLAKQEASYSAETASEVAVLFSTPSRDFVDKNAGTGLYATTAKNPDKLWWSFEDTWSTYKLNYVGDYRGICKTLIHGHVPYDTLVMPHLKARRKRYKMIVAPSLAAISEADAQELVQFVEEGGTLVLSGPDPGRFDENGGERAKPLLLEKFNFALPEEASGTWSRVPMGSGFAVWTPELAGLAYFSTEDNRTFDFLMQLAFEAVTGGQIKTNAPPPVIMNLRRKDNVTWLLISNLDGLGSEGVGKFTPDKATFNISVRLPPGQTAKEAIASEPTEDASDKELEFSQTEDYVTFDITVSAVMAVKITT
jgi:hypothetical protein